MAHIRLLLPILIATTLRRCTCTCTDTTRENTPTFSAERDRRALWTVSEWDAIRRSSITGLEPMW